MQSIPQPTNSRHQKPLRSPNLRENFHKRECEPPVGNQKTDSLGIYARNSSPSEELPETDQRWQLLKHRYQMLSTARDLLPDERIAACKWWVSPTYSAVRIAHNYENGRATLRNLIYCKSPSCPVCSFIQSEKQRSELAFFMALASGRGLFPVMLTLTLRHQFGDTLETSLKAAKQAYKRLTSGKAWMRFKAAWGVVCAIRKDETTFGKNGFHPHFHVLLFCDEKWTGLSLQHIKTDIYPLWLTALQNAGFDANFEHGVDVIEGDSAVAEYIAKHGREPILRTWGVEAEIANSPHKTGGDGMTPLELLAVAAGSGAALAKMQTLFPAKSDDELRAWSGVLYVEYYRTAKGTRRLEWGESKKLLNFDELYAAYLELNKQNNPEIDLVLLDGHSGWRDVMRGDRRAAIQRRTEIAATAADPEQLTQWLEIAGIDADVLATNFVITSHKVLDVVSDVAAETADPDFSNCGDKIPISLPSDWERAMWVSSDDVLYEASCLTSPDSLTTF